VFVGSLSYLASGSEPTALLGGAGAAAAALTMSDRLIGYR